MPENKQDVFKSFSVPKKFKKLAQEKLIETSLTQIAQAKELHAYYLDQAKKATDPKKANEHKLKAQQLADAQLVNIGYLEFAGWKG